MTRDITFDRTPDLRRIYATALVTGRAPDHATDAAAVPPARAVRSGITVDLDNLVDYSRLCGFTLSGALPLTYPHLLAFPLQVALMSEREFPLALMGAVHIENVIDQVRPVLLDETIDVAVQATNLRPHRRGRQVDLVSEATVGRELVWREVSTYLSRGTEHPDAPPSQPPTLEGLDAVTTGPTWRFDEGVGRSYAAVSGDWNPIHLHALTARPLGFPTAIAHGMYSYGRVVAALANRLPAGHLTSHVWFGKPVRLPSKVRLRTAVEPTRTLSVLESAGGDLRHAVVEHSS